MEKKNRLGSQDSNSRGSSHPVIPTIISTNYDAEIAKQQQLLYDERNRVNSCSGSSPKTPLAESEEEDIEIIEALTKAHSNNSNRHIDVDEASSSTHAAAAMKSEDNKDCLPSTSSGIEDGARGLNWERSGSLMTDDDMADLEVSQLTDLLESKNTFSPLPGNLTQINQRANARFVPTFPALGILPDISTLSVPRRVPAKKNPGNWDLSTNDGASSSISEMGNGNAGVTTFSAGSRYNRAECLPRKSSGEYPFGRRTVRQYGESDSDSQYSSSSSTVNSENSDDQPPQYWKLYDNNSDEKSDGGNKEKEDINQILQTFQVIDVNDNASSLTSKDLTESFPSKQSKDDDKNDDKNNDKNDDQK